MSVTTSSNEQPTWAADVRELLTAAKIKESHVVERSGLAGRAVLWRYLRGERRPNEGTARKINAAVASLIGVPEVEPYLLASWCFEHPEDSSLDWWREAYHGSLKDWSVLLRYLRIDFIRKESGDLRTLKDLVNEATLPRLAFALHRLRLRELLRYIVGEPPKRTRFEEMRAVFKQYGVDLTLWLRPEKEIASARVEETFYLTLQREVFKLNNDPRLRREAEEAIIAAAKSAGIYL